MTAAPARVPTPAPKAAPKVAAALLESTLAGGLGVDTIQIETPETAFEIKPVETRTVQITVVENDPEYEAELAEQEARAKALLDAENEPGEELPPVGAAQEDEVLFELRLLRCPGSVEGRSGGSGVIPAFRASDDEPESRQWLMKT